MADASREILAAIVDLKSEMLAMENRLRKSSTDHSVEFLGVLVEMRDSQKESLVLLNGKIDRLTLSVQRALAALPPVATER